MRKLLSADTFVALACGCASEPSPRSIPQRAALTPTAAAAVTVTLTADQAASVRAYLSSSNGGSQTSRGRGRSGGLPPGIAKNLGRGKALPPGIAKAYLPTQIIATLPRLPSGLNHIVVAGKLLLVDAATQIIRDVLVDIAS